MSTTQLSATQLAAELGNAMEHLDAACRLLLDIRTAAFSSLNDEDVKGAKQSVDHIIEAEKILHGIRMNLDAEYAAVFAVVEPGQLYRTVD